MTGWCCDYVCRIVIYPEQQCLSLEYMLGWEPYNVRYLHLVSRHRRPQRADGNLLETRSQHAVPSNLRSVKSPIPQCHIFNASTMARKPGNCANPSHNWLTVPFVHRSNLRKLTGGDTFSEKNSMISCTSCTPYIFWELRRVHLHASIKTYSACTRTTTTSAFVASPQLS